jgi:hypothetical protein
MRVIQLAKELPGSTPAHSQKPDVTQPYNWMWYHTEQPGSGRTCICQAIGIGYPASGFSWFFLATSSTAWTSPHFQKNYYLSPLLLLLSRDSVVGIATGYGLDDRRVGVRVPVGSRIFSCPRSQNWFWGPLSLLSNGYRGLFPRAAGASTWPLTSS